MKTIYISVCEYLCISQAQKPAGWIQTELKRMTIMFA